MTENKHAIKGWVALGAIILILVIDQIIKVEVKTNMYLHESIRITDWFYISFVENNGMAYGMTFINKLALTLFRMAAITVIGVYLYRQVKANARWVYVVCLALVMAGAAGNLIDCIFYGKIFSLSTPDSIAHFVPWGQGYEDAFTERWSICSTSPSSRPTCHSGCPSGAVSITSSSVRCSISPTPASLVGSSRCCSSAGPN